MAVSVQILRGNSVVAVVTYKPGFLVDVKVTRSFRTQKIAFRGSNPGNKNIEGDLPEMLDKYFNEWIFESRSDLLPDEPARVGAAREHKSLFLNATRILEKDLIRMGYRFEVSFQ